MDLDRCTESQTGGGWAIWRMMAQQYFNNNQGLCDTKAVQKLGGKKGFRLIKFVRHTDSSGVIYTDGTEPLFGCG
jgi:hypothetical protein